MKNWFVVYTKSRSEKKAALLLKSLGVNVYCPLVTEIHQWSDRKKKVEVPLIKSYLFVYLEEKEREIVFQVPGIIRYIFWLGKPAIVQEKEIDLLKQHLNGDIIEASVEHLKVGDSMKISSGPFRGKDGVVNEFNNNSIQLILTELNIKITLKRNH